jgi:hypothetical protein
VERDQLTVMDVAGDAVAHALQQHDQHERGDRARARAPADREARERDEEREHADLCERGLEARNPEHAEVPDRIDQPEARAERVQLEEAVELHREERQQPEPQQKAGRAEPLGAAAREHEARERGGGRQPLELRVPLAAPTRARVLACSRVSRGFSIVATEKCMTTRSACSATMKPGSPGARPSVRFTLVSSLRSQSA